MTWSAAPGSVARRISAAPSTTFCCATVRYIELASKPISRRTQPLSSKKGTTMTAITDLKTISYDRDTRDFLATFDGNPIGFFPNYSAAEDALNDYALHLCEEGLLDYPLPIGPEPMPE